MRWAAVALLATAVAGCKAGSRGDLESPDPRRRAAAVQRLGASRHPGDLAALLVAQQDPDPGVRRAAAAAYGGRGGVLSQEGLAAMLGDADPEVVTAAARALGAIRPDDATADARAAADLQRRAALSLAGAYGRADARGRAEIALALQAVGGSLRDAVEAEARWMWDRNTRELGSPSPAGRAGAAEELGRSGRAEAVRLLDSLLDRSEGDPRWTAAIARGLGWSGDGTVVERLESAIRSRWAEVAESATWALGNVGDPRAADLLAEQALSAPTRVASAAVAALDALPGAPEVGMALCEVAVRSPDPVVAERAAAGARSRGAECPERPVTLRIGKGGPETEAALAALGALGLRGERLAGPGDRAVALLTTSSSPRLRAAAARALGSAGYVPAVPALQRRATAIQERAARVPGRPDPGSAAVSPDEEELGEVAVALARLAPDSAAPLAVRLAGDPDARLRAAAARALGASRSGESGAALAPLAMDADPSVRLAAIAALGARGEGSLQALLAALAAHPAEGEEATAMARALGATHDPAALPALASMLDGDRAPAAAAAIGRLGSPAGVPALVAVLGRAQPAGRVEVIDALASLGGPEAGDSLSGELTSDRPEVRVAAARALGRLRHEGAATRLEALRGDYYVDVRRAAVEALARLPVRAPPRHGAR